MTAAAKPTSAWLHGRAVDLLFGAGFAYLVTVPLLVVAASRGFSEWSLEQILILSLLFNTPHYGATLVRVLGRPAARRRYALVTRWTTIAMAVLFVAGTELPLVGSALVTVYLLWSPWHFGGQNYGLALTFLRRHGVTVEPRLRRTLYTAFWLSFGVALLASQTSGSATFFAPDITSTADGIAGLRFGLPASLTIPGVLGLGVAYVALAGFAISRLIVAKAPPAAVGAVVSLLACQACWFVIPAVGLMVGRPFMSLAFTALWASVAHSIQYLWVTSYYAQREEADFNWARWLTRVGLAGSFVVVVPGLAATYLLPGAPSWVGGLGVLGASVVNLHHFIIDGAIWKLRDGQVARILLRDDRPGDDASDASVPRMWAMRGAAIAAAVCALVLVIEVVDANAENSRDIARLEAATSRLGWIGRDRIAVRGTLGQAYIAADQRDRGLDLLRDTLELKRDADLLNNLAWTLSTDARSTPAEHAESVGLAEEAVALDGGRDADSHDTLAAAYASVGRFEEATLTADRAIEIARARNRPDLVGFLQRRNLYRSGQPYVVP